MTNNTFDISTDWHPLMEENPPAWASGAGEDQYGLFVDFSIKTGNRYWDYIDQRLRWIPPGQFLMGAATSADGIKEPGSYDDEFPQHSVALSHGFWLMDTPVTQELYRQVIGADPSRFKDPKRPVESVDWNDCVASCNRLSEIIGVPLSLPTEAQWEYVCRAGTKTATYAGDLEILGKNHAPLLDSIAWYGGNSGWEFDLEEGYDSTSWPEKQYEHSRAGTRQVGLKDPNPFGLFYMLGNVWEWCRDDMRTYADQSVVDPGDLFLVGNDGAVGGSRVIRGGSWSNSAARRARRGGYGQPTGDHRA